MFKNPAVRNILSALVIAIFGFILLNLTFLFDFIFHNIIDGILRIFIKNDFNMNLSWYPPMKHLAFMILIGLVSWLIFRTKWKVIYKAIFMTMPTAVILATVGMFLYQWPIVPYLVGGLLALGTLYYFHRTKQPWQYWYVVILISVVLAIMTFLGVDI